MDLHEIDAAIEAAKDRWDHAAAPHEADVLALIRAAEAMRTEIARPGPAEKETPLFTVGLTFRNVSDTNLDRAKSWHPGFPDDGWTGSDWSNAMCGEAGEAANVVKKLRRDEFGIQQAASGPRPALLAKLAMELGDTFLYADLLAQYYGLDLGECVAGTFNRVSEREDLPQRLPVPDPAPAA